MSRVAYQGGVRAMQGIKDQAAKCDSTIRSIKESSRQARKLSSAIESTGSFKKLQQAEESLRTVMFLSCWGPN